MWAPQVSQPAAVLLLLIAVVLGPSLARSPTGYHSGFQLLQHNSIPSNQYSPSSAAPLKPHHYHQHQHQLQQAATNLSLAHSGSVHRQPPEVVSSAHGCPNGLLTFELSTGFIYKPSALDTLAMMPSTLQLTDCLEFCLQNSTCLAINFEMGLCVLLSSSAKQNPSNLFSSQFPVFTIYAEKKCLLQGTGEPQVAKQRLKCQRAWTFERVAGHEMKSRPRKRLKLISREQCMEACLLERDFECRSANWYRHALECTLSDQDRHSASLSEAGDQQVNANQLLQIYGPSNLTAPPNQAPLPRNPTSAPAPLSTPSLSTPNSYMGLYDNYYASLDRIRASSSSSGNKLFNSEHLINDLMVQDGPTGRSLRPQPMSANSDLLDYPALHYANAPSSAPVDYLENNCVYEPNKLCEFRKIQNKVLKTVDSIYQDVGSLEECKQKCLSAPYRCYSFDYGDTSERVCRTSHLDQASLLTVKEPYLEVMGAITYELAACFSVVIQCRAKDMVVQVSSSKTFRGRIYAKSRPNSCVNDVKEALHFELSMRYHDPDCDVRATSNQQRGVFSNDIVIQHHDRIVTTQDVGLSLYCQYDLGNRSITNNVDLAIERIGEAMESKSQGGATSGSQDSTSSLAITSLATTVVRSPNVTMRITNMNGQPVTSATVGDRLALLFEIKEKTTPFGIFVREIIALDGKQMLAAAAADNAAKRGYHYSGIQNGTLNPSAATASEWNENSVDSMFQAANWANSVQFIDSEGCPTDANIMGPLVRLDPAGHRILAPFDAFKFPSSDMVFFRATVTSCVSECRPPVCTGAYSLASEPQPPMAPFYSSTTMLASPSTSASTTPSQPQPANPVTSTTTTSSLHGQPLQLDITRAPQRNEQEPSNGGGSSSTSLDWTYSTTEDSLMDRSNATGSAPHWLSSSSSSSSSSSLPVTATAASTSYEVSTGTSLFADLSTTVASFSGRPVAASAHPADSSLLPAQTMIGAPTTQQTPSTTQTSSSQTSATTQRTLLKLDPSQRQQILKLIESKLRQQLASGNASFPDMANLYASLLTSVMLDGVAPGSGSGDARRHLGGGSSSESASPATGGESGGGGGGGIPSPALEALRLSPAEADKLASEFVRANLLQANQAQANLRRRRKRSLQQHQLQVHHPAKPVTVRQKQQAQLGSTPEIRFTTSLAEMYHHPAGEPLRRRTRRQARSSETEPHYDMDELFMQSIKIVDRLHFSDEQVGPSSQRSRGHRSLNRSQLVTATDDNNPRGWTNSGSVWSVVVVAALALQMFFILVCVLEFNHRRRLRAAVVKRRCQLQTNALLNRPTASQHHNHHYKISSGGQGLPTNLLPAHSVHSLYIST